MASAEEAKGRGNAAFSAGNFTDAVKHYTEAIALSQSNVHLYCDRSAAYASLDDFPSALSDARRAVQLDSSWPACYICLGAAYLGLGNYTKSVSSYQNGLRLAPTNEPLKAGLVKATGGDRFLLEPFGGPFGLRQQPQRMQHLCTQPPQLLTQNQFMRNAANYVKRKPKKRGKVNTTPSTYAQIIGSSQTVLSADLAANDAMSSTSARSLRSGSAPLVAELVASKKQKLAADAFDLPGDLVKLTEQPSNIWANVQTLWTPQAKARHTNMANSLDIASEAIVMQWQGLQASLGTHEALKRAREDLEKAEAQHKKEKEANGTLTQKNLELEESVNTLQTRVKELENGMSKMLEDHAQLNVELKEAASYFGWKARIEMMEEFVAGKHMAWNPSEERALFLEAYPPVQTKEKDDPVKEEPAQDVDKETV